MCWKIINDFRSKKKIHFLLISLHLCKDDFFHDSKSFCGILQMPKQSVNFYFGYFSKVHLHNQGVCCESNQLSLLWIQPRSLLWIQPRSLMWIQPRSLLWIQPIESVVNPTNWVCFESNQLSLLWIQPRSLLWIQPRSLLWIQPRSLLGIQPICNYFE